MSKCPLVSIGLPTYNRPEGLTRTVQYLLTQDYKNIEVIISDNNSSDKRVRETLEKFSSSDNRIEFIIQTENIEIEPNFNFVFSKAKGKYFMWMADDDIFDHNYITKCVAFLEDNNDYYLCSGLTTYFDSIPKSFTEKPIILNNTNGLVRMFNYYLRVQKNGIFYGLYRNNMNFHNPIEHYVGSDWNHIGRIAILGKIHTLTNVKILRSDKGGSSSRQKIISRWAFAGWKKYFLEINIAYLVSRNFFNQITIRNKYNALGRKIIQLIIFNILIFKFLYNSFIKRYNLLFHK